MYFKSDVPPRRQYDLDKALDCGESDLAILIIETVINNKERCAYVMRYKPLDVKPFVSSDAFSLTFHSK